MSYFGLQYIFNYSNVDPVRKMMVNCSSVVLARISENKNINIYYLDDHSYKAHINSADDDKSGEIVKVTINKKWVFQT